MSFRVRTRRRGRARNLLFLAATIRCLSTPDSCMVSLPRRGSALFGADFIMRTSHIIAYALLCVASLCFAQTGPEKGGHEVQIWAGGGHSVSGGRGDTSAFNAGLRYGWIL